MTTRVLVALFLLAGFGTVAQAGPITLTYTVTVTSFCQAGGSCEAYNATFPLTAIFDDQPTDTQIYAYAWDNPATWYIIRYFGAPTMTETPLPTLANPYGGVEVDTSSSRAVFQSDNVVVGGYRQASLHSGQLVNGGQWATGVELGITIPAAFPPLDPEMPTAESFVAVLSGPIDFRQYGYLLSGGGEGAGSYKGTATLVAMTAVPDASATLLLLGMGVAGLVAAKRRWR